MSEPKVGDLRVWHTVFLRHKEPKYRYRPVRTPQEAYDYIHSGKGLSRKWVQHDAFGLEVYMEGGWEVWCDEEGRDMDEAFESAAEGGA